MVIKLTDKKLLKLWRNAALERAGYKCEFPDCNIKYSQLHAHHIYHRSHVSLRYVLENAIILCPHHHTLGSLSAHKNPDFKDHLVATGVRTEEFFDRLREERNRVQKNTAVWKQECYDRLKIYL
jgi:5-methylcytosine-specific restriction endonuclease McrA